MAKNKMEPIQWKDGCDYVWQNLGLSQDRVQELGHRMDLIVHELARPVRNPEEAPDTSQILKLFVALAENQQELVFCAYIGGMEMRQLYDEDEDNDETEFTHSELRFEIGRKKYKFDVVHNLPETFGMNIEGALDNWLARTRKHTVQSFCEYVTSKDPSNIVCMPKSEFDKM